MRIVLWYKRGIDFPSEIKSKEIGRFSESLEKSVRERLELRNYDVVEIHLE
jgi:hypothetical protein